MKVKDLIEELKQADPESDVIWTMNDGCCSDYLFLDLDYTDETIHTEFKQFTFRFKALDLIATCILSGRMRRELEKRNKELGRDK